MTKKKAVKGKLDLTPLGAEALMNIVEGKVETLDPERAVKACDQIKYILEDDDALTNFELSEHIVVLLESVANMQRQIDGLHLILADAAGLIQVKKNA